MSGDPVAVILELAADLLDREHATRIVAETSFAGINAWTYRAECSCRWFGATWASESPAANDAIKHRRRMAATTARKETP